MADLERRLVMGGMLSWLAGTRGAQAAAATAYEFSFTAIEGGPLPLAQFQGRPLLVVNTASFCGYTPQYAGLQRLHERFGARGLVVLGVPSNDFFQESRESETIKAFCDTQFGVTFPMTTPEAVRGRGAHPLFTWLAERSGGAPLWNFHKYLVARDGSTVQRFGTRTDPEAPDLVRAIETALG